MTDILIAFVIPILVIIVSAVLESLCRSPFKVTAIIFVVLVIAVLIIGVTLSNFILVWIYTLLAFITAIVVERFLSCRCHHRRCGRFQIGNIGISNNNENNCNEDDENDNNDIGCNRCNRRWGE